MQKSPCCETVRVIHRKQLITATSFISVDYDALLMSVLAAIRRIPPGLLHDISKTGPVHAKIRVLGIKRFTTSAIFTNSAICVTFRLLFGSLAGGRAAGEPPES
jgi:hypothetical protein